MVADVRPQPTFPDPPDDLTQLGTIGHDDEVDRQAVRTRQPHQEYVFTSSTDAHKELLADFAKTCVLLMIPVHPRVRAAGRRYKRRRADVACGRRRREVHRG
jgi:hypothetical protein